VLLFGLLWFRPRKYLGALFALAPLGGIWVQFGWMMDLFKIGLIMSPLLLLRESGPLGKIARPVAGLLLWAASLLGWQLATHEIQSADSVGHIDFVGRMIVANGMFFLRVLLLVLIGVVIRTREELQGILKAFVWSVFLSSVYAIGQEVAFVTGAPLSGVNTVGLQNLVWVFPTVQVGNMTLVRVNAFSPEPKDFALFLVPCMALLWSSRSGGGPICLGSSKLYWLQVGAMTVAGALTFSSSLYLMTPLLVAVFVLLQPKRNLERVVRQAVAAAALVVFLVLVSYTAPVLPSAWTVRTTERFSGAIDILQVSRERPAWEFVRKEFPRSLLGYGVGTQAFYLPALMSAEYRQSLLNANAAAGLDSFWFGLFVDLGIPGVVLFCWACRLALRTSRNGSKASTWPYRAALTSALIISIPLAGDLRSGLVWLMLGVCWRHRELSRTCTLPGHVLNRLRRASAQAA
jgi:hypothetical protein